jgi:hypothetical protein
MLSCLTPFQSTIFHNSLNMFTINVLDFRARMTCLIKMLDQEKLLAGELDDGVVANSGIAGSVFLRRISNLERTLVLDPNHLEAKRRLDQ